MDYFSDNPSNTTQRSWTSWCPALYICIRLKLKMIGDYDYHTLPSEHTWHIRDIYVTYTFQGIKEFMCRSFTVDSINCSSQRCRWTNLPDLYSTQRVQSPVGIILWRTGIPERRRRGDEFIAWWLWTDQRRWMNGIGLWEKRRQGHDRGGETDMKKTERSLI